MNSRFLLPVVTVLAISAAPCARGTVIVQELFDAIAGPPPGTDSTLDGKGSTSTSIGLSGNWTATNTGIYTASNFDGGAGLPGLPAGGGETGGVWNRTNSYSTGIYATRLLTTAIDFGVDQVLYFSVVVGNPGDTAMGIGLSAGSAAGSEFVGAGVSWNNARSLATGLIDASNAAYIGYGTLGADSGPYGIRNHGAMNSVNGSALLVGRLTLSATGPDLIDIVSYGVGATIDANPSLVTWSASDSYDTDMVADSLLLWINGGGFGGGELDAIRFGTNWSDVTGVPEPGTLGLSALALLGLARRRR